MSGVLQIQRKWGDALTQKQVAHYQAQLELLDKGRAIKGFVWIWSLGPAKRSGARLFTTVPWGMIHINFIYLFLHLFDI